MTPIPPDAAGDRCRLLGATSEAADVNGWPAVHAWPDEIGVNRSPIDASVTLMLSFFYCTLDYFPLAHQFTSRRRRPCHAKPTPFELGSGVPTYKQAKGLCRSLVASREDTPVQKGLLAGAAPRRAGG
ncbi:hypothetical protein THAOC_05667, partial [Thalassiosira oceanica]